MEIKFTKLKFRTKGRIGAMAHWREKGGLFRDRNWGNRWGLRELRGRARFTTPRPPREISPTLKRSIRNVKMGGGGGDFEHMRELRTLLKGNQASVNKANLLGKIRIQAHRKRILRREIGFSWKWPSGNSKGMRISNKIPDCILGWTWYCDWGTLRFGGNTGQNGQLGADRYLWVCAEKLPIPPKMLSSNRVLLYRGWVTIVRGRQHLVTMWNPINILWFRHGQDVERNSSRINVLKYGGRGTNLCSGR